MIGFQGSTAGWFGHLDDVGDNQHNAGTDPGENIGDEDTVVAVVTGQGE